MKNKGFTLVELIVTMGIISVFLVVVGFAFNSTTGIMVKTYNENQIQIGAQVSYTQMEEIIKKSVAYYCDSANSIYYFKTDGNTYCIKTSNNSIGYYKSSGYEINDMQNVNSVTVTPHNNGSGCLDYVNLRVVVSKGSQSYTVKKCINCINKPAILSKESAVRSYTP